MKLIVALCKNNYGIGLSNEIPWNIRSDLEHFRKTTTNTDTYDTYISNDFRLVPKNVVVMGRKTWDSIPEKYRPLKDRINIVLSKNTDPGFIEDIEKNENTFVKHSFSDITSLDSIHKNFKIGSLFVIGGSSIYREAIETGKVEELIITEIYKKFDCDTYFPKPSEFPEFILTTVSKFYEENGTYFRYLSYKNKNICLNLNKWQNHEEHEYLKCMKNILKTGIPSDDRTGVGTLSIFGEKFEYDLGDTFPALTTKRVFFKGIVEELLLYISGKTDNSILNEKNIHIWDGNTTRDFLNKRGLSHYPENDMGETYGFNFRHYGGEYKTCKEDYSGMGFDQIKNAVELIKTNPGSRRIIINLWNPATNHKAALPSCLCFYQFYVDTKNQKLNLQIYIRSSDFFLANNWNTLTGALMVHMICNLKDISLTPGILKVITGDTHLYKTHLEQVKENLERTPRPFPKLVISEEKNNIEDYKYEDFKLVGYSPYKNISADMAV